MANVLSPANRHVVPNFRRFADTAALGELDSARILLPDAQPIDFESRITEWNSGRSVGLAADIVSAALVSGNVSIPEVSEAAAYILENADSSSLPLSSAANRILNRGQQSSGFTDLLPRINTFLENHSRQAAYRRIGELKRAIARFGPNAIGFTELARLYLILGSERKARRNIDIALSLAPNNRYVLRSAARLYAHFDDAERALHLLRRNSRTLHDPWLASAELAMAGLMGKPGPSLKNAARMLSSEQFSPFSLAELRAGLGSVELLEGNRRASRRLLQASLEEPNDNALAQVEWALSLDRMFDVDVGSFDLNRNYEAFALAAFNERQWTSVLRHCESWFMDMPFARRPVMMASNVATVALDDWDSAVLFCQAGRISSPHDPALVNNLAYALALGGNPEAALKTLDELPLNSAMQPQVQVCLTATRGLAYFRLHRIAEGRALYTLAIEAAQKVSDVSYAHLALLHFVREEILANEQLPEAVIKKVRDLKVDARSVITQILKDKVLKLLDSAPSRAGEDRP